MLEFYTGKSIQVKSRAVYKLAARWLNLLNAATDGIPEALLNHPRK